MDLQAGYLNIAVLLDGGRAAQWLLGARKKKKKTYLQTSLTNSEKVKEKLFTMEQRQKKNAPLH
jgi:hypothetical protein